MRFLLALSLCSVVLLSSCMSREKEMDRTPVTSPKYVQELSRASSKIKDTQEFEACMQPSVNMCVNQVGNQLARTNKSVAFCDELSTPEGKDACKYGVVSLEAVDKKDIKLCDTLTDSYKKECRIMITRMSAVDSGDIKKCDAIASEMGASGSVSAIEKSRVDQCRFDTIVRKNPTDAKVCDAIDDENIAKMCTSMIKMQREVEVSQKERIETQVK